MELSNNIIIFCEKPCVVLERYKSGVYKVLFGDKKLCVFHLKDKYNDLMFNISFDSGIISEGTFYVFDKQNCISIMGFHDINVFNDDFYIVLKKYLKDRFLLSEDELNEIEKMEKKIMRRNAIGVFLIWMLFISAAFFIGWQALVGMVLAFALLLILDVSDKYSQKLSEKAEKSFYDELRNQ